MDQAATLEREVVDMIETQRPPDLLDRTLALLSQSDDLTGLTEGELLQAITAAEEVKASVAALQARATTAFVEARDADAALARARGDISRHEARARRSAARTEVALARRCSPFQADRHVSQARALCTDLPRTLATLTAGAVSEHRATIVARETECLSPEDRVEVDARLAGDLTRLGDKALTAAVQRACIAVDQMSIVERRRRAAARRCVSVRPAPDGMAYLSVLGPLVDVVGAYASLTAAEAARWVATGDPEIDATRAADDRGRGAWLSDTALERLSGRAEGQAQPVEVGLVMSDTALFPTSSRTDGHTGEGAEQSADGHTGEGAGQSAEEGAAEVAGWGAVPAADARDHLLRLLDDDIDEREARVWLRRLFTSPDGRDLVSTDSTRRFFTGALRSLIELRDPTCRIPWCDAPTRQIDHAVPAAEGGPTSVTNALGLCQRHNLTKETPGWLVEVTSTGLDPGGGPHEVRLTTPTGGRHSCPAPPLLGHGRTRERPRDRPRPRTTGSALEAHFAQLLRDAA